MSKSTIMRVSLLALATLSLGGCVSEDYLRVEGVTPFSGNAVAANTVLQMVDPWPAGVEDTNLVVPAERDTPVPALPGAEAGDDYAEK